MPIEIVPYDSGWPERFRAEAARLQAALGSVVVRVDHVGSTSVPGLAAKDVIDIQLAVRSFDPENAYRGSLERLGYQHRDDPGTPEHRFFGLRAPDGRRLVNLHVVEAGSEWGNRNLAFRDHLRAEPALAADYARLKRELAARFGVVDDYADAKSDFIDRVIGPRPQRRAGG